MKAFGILLTVLLAVSPSGANPGVERLVKQLGSDEVGIRENATRSLIDKGSEAVKPLLQSALSDNQEVRQRSERILDEILLWADLETVLAGEVVLRRAVDGSGSETAKLAAKFLDRMAERRAGDVQKHLRDLGASFPDEEGLVHFGRNWKGADEDFGYLRFAEEEPDLDDPEVREKILKQAVSRESFEARGPDGKKLYYQAGKQTPYTGWAKGVHENGQLAVLVQLKDGKGEGRFTSWHRNGQKELEGTLKDGKQDGPWTMWHDNGKKKEECTYKNGKWDGLRTEWNKDGKVLKQTRYKDGKRDGLQTEWNEDGKVLKQTRYMDGVEVKE